MKLVSKIFVVFSHSIMCHSLQSHGLQHTRLPCPLLSPGVCSNSCPLNQWCCPTISSSSAPFSSSIKVFSNELSLCIRWPKYWSFSFSISPSSDYSALISLGLSDLISLLPKGLSRVFFSTTVWKYQLLCTQPSLWSNCHIHTWLLEKMHIWLYRPLSAKWCVWVLICCLCPS